MDYGTREPEWKSVFAVAFYKEGSQCKYAHVGVSYSYNALTRQWSRHLYEPVIKEGYPIDCAKIK